MTFEEIVLTGGLGTLSNVQLREALMAYQSEQGLLLEFADFVRRDFVNVVDEYPDVL